MDHQSYGVTRWVIVALLCLVLAGLIYFTYGMALDVFGSPP